MINLLLNLKKLPLYISLLLLLTCAKEDSQDPGTTPSNITPRYTLTASAGEGGSVAPTTGSFNAGTQVSVTATPSSGYTFSGWSNGSTANPFTVTLNSNTSITANFALIPVYIITVSAEDGGSVSSNGGEYQQGTEVTLTATPDEGYEFSGWSDGSTEATRVITASENLSLTASFTELIISYTLTVTSGEGGSVNSQGGEYNEGTEITLTATPGEGYRFTGWSDGSTEESITITLSEDTSIEALFELIPVYTVTVTAEGGEVTGAGEYQEGTEITLTASASEGYRFTGWSDGSTGETIAITLYSDTALTANFELLLNGFYQYNPMRVGNEFRDSTVATLAADLDGDGNDELILTIANPVNHSNSSLMKKTPIKVLSFKDEKLVDVTNSFFSEVPSTYYTRNIFFEDLNHDGLKDLYFANHGAEVEDISVFYHQESGERIDGIWSEKDWIYFNNNGIFQKADYFDVSDYSHGANIINITSNGKNSILRNELSPPPWQLGGKNSIITFENGEFTINNIISGVEDNLYQRYFCSGSFWMYPIDIDGDGIDEVVTQSEIIKCEDNSYSLSSLMEGKYASQNFLINESGFVIDIDNDGDEDLIKGATLTSENCTLVNFIDRKLEFYENVNGVLNPNTGKLPSHPSNLGIYVKPFDVNFDGLLDIVFYGYSPTEPNIFFMNNGNGFELKEFNLDQFDGSFTYWDGTQLRIQQFDRLQHSYFLESNDGYIFITGIDEALIAFRITDQNFNMFIK